MTELEKVIAGLESCRPGRNCDGCPYHELFMKGRCNKQMEEDALVLLKEQEKKIVSLQTTINRLHEGIQKEVKWDA